MDINCKISVNDLRFFSHHGFYPEEQLLGNEYFVSIQVNTSLHSHLQDDLDNTLNYEELYQIARDEMATPQKLLETVAQNMLASIHSKNTDLAYIEVCICKINPPFGGDKAKSEVTLSWTRKS